MGAAAKKLSNGFSVDQVRVIDLDPGTVGKLHAHRLRQEAENVA